ncbi:MAG: hypothetical protein KJ941_10985 [Bacteroidetes bacterium]|nr:hypothetical protein [Bacteroidota bacterium]
MLSLGQGRMFLPGLGVDEPNPINTLDVKGNTVIGNSYSGTNTAPLNGLLVQGIVGIGTTSPLSKLGINGNASVGITYSGINAPADGMIVEGRLGVGTSSPNTRVDVNGDLAIRQFLFTTMTTGSNHNVTFPTGSTFVRISGPTSDFKITGISGGQDGKMLILYNSTNYRMKFVDQNDVDASSSTAINRIIGAESGDTEFKKNTSAILIYSKADSRWLIIGIIQK